MTVTNPRAAAGDVEQLLDLVCKDSFPGHALAKLRVVKFSTAEGAKPGEDLLLPVGEMSRQPLLEQRRDGERKPQRHRAGELRARFGGKLIANSGFGSITTREEAAALVADSNADAVAVGRLVIANPDLVERWQGNQVENTPNAQTFYGPGAEGYTDYPRLSA